jgi:hypothetical protein
MVTPKMSMRTWMVVELCAGSIPKYRMTNGKTAPIMTDKKTIQTVVGEIEEEEARRPRV